MTGVKDMLGDLPPAWADYPDGPGHARGSATSRAAADSVRPHLGRLQAKVLAFVVGRGARGATYDEVVAGCALGAPTVCGRMVELVEARLVKKSRRTRPTASGRQAVVYLGAEVPDE